MRKILLVAPLLLLASGCLISTPKKKAALLGQIPTCHEGRCGTVDWIKFDGKCYRKPVMYFTSDHGVMWDAEPTSIEECQKAEPILPAAPEAE